MNGRELRALGIYGIRGENNYPRLLQDIFKSFIGVDREFHDCLNAINIDVLVKIV